MRIDECTSSAFSTGNSVCIKRFFFFLFDNVLQTILRAVGEPRNTYYTNIHLTMYTFFVCSAINIFLIECCSRVIYTTAGTQPRRFMRCTIFVCLVNCVIYIYMSRARIPYYKIC